MFVGFCYFCIIDSRLRGNDRWGGKDKKDVERQRGGNDILPPLSSPRRRGSLGLKMCRFCYFYVIDSRLRGNDSSERGNDSSERVDDSTCLSSTFPNLWVWVVF